jgi:hypothetical protein
VADILEAVWDKLSELTSFVEEVRSKMANYE